MLTALYLALYSSLHFSSPAVLWVADFLWVDGCFLPDNFLLDFGDLLCSALSGWCMIFYGLCMAFFGAEWFFWWLMCCAFFRCCIVFRMPICCTGLAFLTVFSLLWGLMWLASSNYELWVFFTLTLGDSYFPFLAYSCFPITGIQKWCCCWSGHFSFSLVWAVWT